MTGEHQAGTHRVRRLIVAVAAFAMLLPVAISSSAAASGGHTGSCEIAGTNVATSIPESECEALEVLYRALNGSSWPTYASTTPWMTPVDPCTWTGVSCSWPPTDKERHVAQLQLAGRGLSGQLPSEIAQLTELWELNLAGNSIRGELPEELGSMRELQLVRLANNGFEGKIPVGLGSLNNLWTLDLDNNDLEGTLPADLAGNSNIAYLMARGNHLYGEIPSEIGQAINLRGLFISGNEFGGDIPDEIVLVTNLTQAHIFSTSECFRASSETEKFLNPKLGAWQISRVYC